MKFPLEENGLFSTPEPSLCDSCKYSYYLEGGACGYLDEHGIGKHYRQRYCPYPPPGMEKPWGRAIHDHGYQECEYYKRRDNQP